MWWFVWMLSYLGVGSCLMGFVLSLMVKKGRFDPDKLDMPQLCACLVCVVIWPALLCLMIFLGIAHATKDAKKEREEA